MQDAPVSLLMISIIAKDKSMTIKPMIAKVRVFLAPSTCFGSPPEVRNLIPEKSIKKRAATAANPKSQLITNETIEGIQLRVATSLAVLPLNRHPFIHPLGAVGAYVGV